MMLASAFSSAIWTFTLLAALITPTLGHSWVEQLTVIAPNGTFVGEPGFPRGNVLRTNPTFNDNLLVNLIPPNGRPTGNKVLDTDPMCRDTQSTPNQTPGSPALKAAAGSFVALRYQENGHVSLPESTPGKAENRGTVYIYGTTDSKPDEAFLKIHNVWTADGSGGDKRGKLLATRNYDDGRCHQINGGAISQQRQKQFPHQPSQLTGADIWCQNDFALPQDAPQGKPYTIYWVWDWSTAVSSTLPQGLAEIYTSCMDIDITNDSPVAVEAKFVDPNVNTGAIPDGLKNVDGSSSTSGGQSSAQDSNAAPQAVQAAGSAETPVVASTPANSVPVASSPAAAASAANPAAAAAPGVFPPGNSGPAASGIPAPAGSTPVAAASGVPAPAASAPVAAASGIPVAAASASVAAVPGVPAPAASAAGSSNFGASVPTVSAAAASAPAVSAPSVSVSISTVYITQTGPASTTSSFSTTRTTSTTTFFRMRRDSAKFRL